MSKASDYANYCKHERSMYPPPLKIGSEEIASVLPSGAALICRVKLSEKDTKALGKWIRDNYED
jgi:hypothetical protein